MFTEVKAQTTTIEGETRVRSNDGKPSTCNVSCHANTVDAQEKGLKAEALSRSLEADHVSLERATNYVIGRHGFTPDQADRAKRGFIDYMTRVNTGNWDLEPSEEVDVFWHAHLLHTQIYTAWCMQHFGYFVHHVPHNQLCGACGSQDPPPPVH